MTSLQKLPQNREGNLLTIYDLEPKEFDRERQAHNRLTYLLLFPDLLELLGSTPEEFAEVRIPAMETATERRLEERIIQAMGIDKEDYVELFEKGEPELKLGLMAVLLRKETRNKVKSLWSDQMEH